MTPTMHLRFIERTEIIEQNGEASIGRKVKILQQFWETTSGKDVVGDMFVQIYGVWKDIPFVRD